MKKANSIDSLTILVLTEELIFFHTSYNRFIKILRLRMLRSTIDEQYDGLQNFFGNEIQKKRNGLI